MKMLCDSRESSQVIFMVGIFCSVEAIKIYNVY